MTHRTPLVVFASCMALALSACASQPQQNSSSTSVTGSADVSCKLAFSLTGWAAVVKHASGNGIVTCDNGTSAPVTITAQGGGLTVGKYHIDNGHGTFTGVHGIKDTYGKYIQGEVHAGATKSGTAQVMSKGTVSLALAGSGEGVGLGISVGVFDIEPVN